MSAFRIPISLGAMVSFFGLTLSCLNAGSRIIYPMAQHTVFPTRTSAGHTRKTRPRTSPSPFTWR